MCVATAGIISGALAIGSTVASVYSQYQQAEAQAEYQGRLQVARNAQIEQNQVLTMRSYRDQLEAINARTLQQGAATGEQAQQYQKENTRRKGVAQAAGADAGVSGVSRSLLMDEFDRTQQAYSSSLDRQADFNSQSTFFQTQGMQAQAEGRMQSIQPYVPTPVQGPSLFGAAVGIGAGALQGYDRHLFYTGQGAYNPAGPSPTV